MSLSTIEQLLAEIDTEVSELKTVLKTKDSEIASLKSQLAASETVVAGLRADLQGAAKPAKRRNPMLDLCEPASDEVVVAPEPVPKKQRRPVSPGRICIDDLSPQKWQWSDEYDSDEPMVCEPRPDQPRIARRKLKWTLHEET